MVWLLLASSVLGVCISMHRLETLRKFVQAAMADRVKRELIVTYFVTVVPSQSYVHAIVL